MVICHHRVGLVTGFHTLLRLTRDPYCEYSNESWKYVEQLEACSGTIWKVLPFFLIIRQYHNKAVFLENYAKVPPTLRQNTAKVPPLYFSTKTLAGIILAASHNASFCIRLKVRSEIFNFILTSVIERWWCTKRLSSISAYNSCSSPFEAMYLRTSSRRFHSFCAFVQSIIRRSGSYVFAFGWPSKLGDPSVIFFFSA